MHVPALGAPVLCLASGLVGSVPVVLSGGYDGSVRLWSAHADLRLEATLESEQGATFSLAAAGYPDGSCAVIIGSHSRRLSFWLLSPPLAGGVVVGPVHSTFLHTGWCAHWRLKQDEALGTYPARTRLAATGL